jgi:hypothetical protein
MILEYVLLITVFVTLMMKVVFYAPGRAFHEAGPRLGARVEKHLVTGKGFSETSHFPQQWKEKPF